MTKSRTSTGLISNPAKLHPRAHGPRAGVAHAAAALVIAIAGGAGVADAARAEATAVAITVAVMEADGRAVAGC